MRDVGDERATEGLEPFHLLEFVELRAHAAEREEEQEESGGAREAGEEKSEASAFGRGIDGGLGDAEADCEGIDLGCAEEEVVVVAFPARVEERAASVGALYGQAVAVGLAGFADGVDGREITAGKRTNEGLPDERRA